MIIFDTINTLLVIISLFNVALLIPILRNGKLNIQTIMYAINIVTILAWVITMVGFRSQNIYIDIWVRALYVAAIFIGVTYMLFTFYYPVKFQFSRYFITLTLIFAVFTSVAVIFTNQIIIGAKGTVTGEPIIYFGQWYWMYICIILIPFIFGFLRHIYITFKKKGKVLYLLLGYLMSSNIAFVTNLILPWLGIFNFNWVGQYFTIIMVSFTTYSILKFNLMNVKLAAINAGVVLLGIITFSQILFADSSKNMMVSSIVFFVSCVTGYYLIKISKNERDNLEHMVILNKKIKKINGELEQANEKLKSLDKLKSEFVSLASHQLRSPLTVIKGYSSTLTDGVVGELTDKQKEIVRHIYSAAQGLASVVEDFLNVTKIEQGGMKYVFAPTNVKDITLDLISDMKIAAEDRHLEFRSELDEKESFMANADGTKLKQVFLNLVDNSIKYTKEGYVKVSLTKDINTKTITFSVNDSGVGISAEGKTKLFQKFSRGEGSALNSGGSGLGLYLAQEIVEAHKGTISADSEGLGKGSTFSVTIPML